ncbi:hypothetical protein [Pacificibacter sp.]|uniref:polysaccharide deacetylase family protein n=1 Tax=Pacificibacter sp. TaxID=1917866 RepID=UPI00321C2F01
MSGAFVISLDFELMWGVRDHRSIRDYGDAILGGRDAIPEILSRFEKAGINATWATVGLLFAENREEMLEFAPKIRPNYENAELSPYVSIESKQIGRNEREDPLHFGLSLIERISDTPGQEIATHTYSHYYCLEQGQAIESFEADLRASVEIGNAKGYAVQSLVFPRNQTNYPLAIKAADLGIDIYRGEDDGWLRKPRSGAQTTQLFRLVRFLDDALPVAPSKTTNAKQNGPAIDIPATQFLRPWSKRLSLYNKLHIRKIQAEMIAAAKTGGLYHLWWHPHNFGRNTDINLAQLDAILKTYIHCRDEYGMESHSMQSLALKLRSSTTEKTAQ